MSAGRATTTGVSTRPAQLPFALELTSENRDACVSRRASYGVLSGSFKSWSVGPRERATVDYAAKDTSLGRFRTIAFNRETRRATEVIDCVLGAGNAALKYMAGWSTRRGTSTNAATDGTAALGWSGDQWCLYHFQGDYITCGSTTCWPAAASLKRQGKRAWGISNAYASSGGRWACTNDCDIVYTDGWYYDCGAGSSGELAGGSGVAPPGATLSCSANNAFNATATCALSIDGYAAADDSVTWTFTGAGVTVSETRMNLTWSGPVVVGGMVTASIVANGVPYSPSAPLTVVRRSGWTWHDSVSGRSADSTEIDSCFASEPALTAAARCATDGASILFEPAPAAVPNGQGLSIAEVSEGGPNAGLWYVEEAHARIDLRKQVKKLWRANDGPEYTVTGDSLIAHCGTSVPRRVAAANACRGGAFASNFAALISTMMSHEGRHVDTVLVAARESANDPYRLWEPLVAGDSVELLLSATEIYQASHGRVRERSLAIHNTASIAYFDFYDYVNSQWVIRYDYGVQTLRRGD